MISTPASNPDWVDAPYEVSYAFWMPLPRNWANLGRRKRIKYIRFMRKKGNAFEQMRSQGKYHCPDAPRLTDNDIHDTFFNPKTYRGEQPLRYIRDNDATPGLSNPS